MAVNLRLARDILADDPAGATRCSTQLADDVQDDDQELRELAHGIYPPLLADARPRRGAAGRGDRSHAPGRPSAPTGIGSYAQEVEAAIYFCCLEALQNAAKHAAGAQRAAADLGGGRRPAVLGQRRRTRLRRRAGAAAGHGFVNMADRLGAIGGTVRWESQPGQGSTISGSIPVI